MPPRPEDDTVDVRADRAPVLRVAERGDVVRAGGDTGVQEREVRTAPTSSHARGSATSNPVARSSDRTSHPSASSSETAAAPIPEAAPVTSALRNKDDLADVAALLDQRVRRSRLGERELGARPPGGPRPAPTGRPAPPPLRARRPERAHQPPEVEAGDADVPPDDQRRVDVRPHAARVADRDQRPERRRAPSARRRRPRRRPGRPPRRRERRPRTPRTSTPPRRRAPA